MNKFQLSAFLFLVVLSGLQLFGQSRGVNRDQYRIHISGTDENITVDGILDENVWNNADVADNFHRVLPVDTGYAEAATEIRLCYDKFNIYVGIICFDPSPGKRPVESLRRDFAFLKNDNFIVFIDTYNDQTNGFAFGVSPAGAQWDGIQSNGGTVNLDWDIKWRSAVQNYDDRWVAEFAIPFRSLRYNGGAREWGINFSRQDLKINEKSSWAPMPRQFATATLAFTGSLVWDEPLPSSGTRFSFIPYASARISQDKQNGSDFKPKASIGADAKVILSTSMNLDLTLNPDYSQVEVDRQQTNIDRFELFFPEKRQFYLENSDLFANLGAKNMRPFFSRRIGLDSPVRAGARLSGKIGDNWRIGVMDIQTGQADTISAANYGVATIQRKVFRRSVVSAFMVNKQEMNLEDEASVANEYNRVAGLEFNLASADNRWTGKTFYHHSFSPGAKGDGSLAAVNILYSTQYFAAALDQSWVGEDFSSESGYIKRKGYYRINPAVQYRFFPAESRIANHGPFAEIDYLFDPCFSLTDRDVQLGYKIEWLNKSILALDAKDSYIKLLDPFDPTHSSGVPLPAGEAFNWKEIGASFTSDIRKPFNFLLAGRYGGFFNGNKFTVNGELYYRVQPYGSLAIVASYNDLDMPLPYNSAEFILIGPRLDITFTNNIFFTGLVQYNNQINNLNYNLRFQWRFAPVSDLYIVYTENAFPTDYRTKNRGLVIKLSYWFN